MTKVLHPHLLERARRTTARRLAAALVAGLADTDATFEIIGRRIGRDSETVRHWLYDLIDGKTEGHCLDQASDFALGLGCMLEPSVQPAIWLNESENSQAAAVAA